MILILFNLGGLCFWVSNYYWSNRKCVEQKVLQRFSVFANSQYSSSITMIQSISETTVNLKLTSHRLLATKSIILVLSVARNVER